MGNRGNTHRSGIDLDIAAFVISKASVDRVVDRHAPIAGESGDARLICFDDRRKPDRMAGLLQGPIYAQVIQSENTPSANHNVLYGWICQNDALSRFSLPFNRAQAVGIKLKQLIDVIFWFRCGSGAKAGG